MFDRPVRGYCVVGQVTAMIHYDLVKFVPAMEDVFPMIAMGVEAPVPHSVRADHPDICIAAEKHHITIDDSRNVDVIGHRLIGFFDDHRRRGWRWTQRARQYFVYLVRIDNEQALLIGCTPRKERRASD